MRRGEVWTVSAGGQYTGEPRPAVIVQEDHPTDAPVFQMLVEPSGRNGLGIASRLMVDKVTTVPKARLGRRIGKLIDEDVLRLNRALTVFLGLAR